jgi:lipopolysaccharide export LptBFGC system permease protein LptF
MDKGYRLSESNKFDHAAYRRNTLLLLALAFFLIALNLGLALSGQTDIGLYFVPSAIIFLIFSLFYVRINPGSHTIMNVAGIIVFIAFLVVVAFKIISTLGNAGF